MLVSPRAFRCCLSAVFSISGGGREEEAVASTSLEEQESEEWLGGQPSSSSDMICERERGKEGQGEGEREITQCDEGSTPSESK